MIFRNERHARQLADFSGLQFGKLYPTDLDGIIEFGDKLWVMIELKYNNAKLPTGQRILLERLTDALAESGRTAICLVGTHQQTSGDIEVSSCLVVKYRYGGEWLIPKEQITIRTAIEKMMNLSILNT